jgi:metal-responsive CopG/Arc/MetJ family transcriptional regulator
MGRPKLKDKKVSISVTINEELNKKLEIFLEEKKLSKSEYIEYLIKKDKSLNIK